MACQLGVDCGFTIGKMIGKNMGKRLYDHPSDMEPLGPEDRDGKFAQLGLG